MESSALIKKEDGVETAKICRWCLSNDDALEPLANDDSGQCNLQKLSECSGAQINILPGVPLYLCTMCEARSKKMDLLQCNENNDFIEQQNKANNESQSTQNHLDHSSEQTIGTELSIKTEVTPPDAAKDLHKKCYIVHQVNRTYECCGHIPDDLFEAEENPIAIKSEDEEVDEQQQTQTTNDVLDHEQGNQKTNHLESICQDQKDHPVTIGMICPDHTGQKPYQCKICVKAFYSSRILAEHSKVHNKDQQHQCPHCSATYTTINNLDIHIRTHTGKRPYKCKVCDKRFKASGNLAVHSKIHNKDQQHQCPHCSSKFAQFYRLKIHIRTHTGEKPYQCKVCDKAFHASEYLAHHSKIHNRGAWCQCPHCPSKFRSSSYLKIHLRTHTGEKPYQCKVCDKFFHASGILRQHSKIHNKGQDQFTKHQCPYCPSKFIRLFDLNSHIRTHTGEKPYQCKVCDKSFLAAGNLAVHSKIHNNGQKGK